MKSQEKIEKVSADVLGLWDANGLWKAIESEDELGCVLRMHIYFERFLNKYLEIKIKGDLKKIIGEQRDFKPKLAICTSLGMPAHYGLVLHQINQMRNKLAHGKTDQIGNGDMEQLTRLVDEILSDGGKDASKSLSNFQLKIGNIHSEEKKVYLFGQDSNRVSFVLACGAFLSKFSGWMISEILVDLGVPRESIPSL